MPNRYTAVIRNITSDGTNYYVEIGVFDGLHDTPSIIVSFPAGTAASEIQTYVQTIVDNQPVLEGPINALVGSTFRGA